MNRKGFTLIELLVVIAIIGILAAMFMVSFSSTRAKGRDATRKNDLRQLKAKLEEYFADQSPEAYPVAATAAAINGTTDALSVALVPDYIATGKMPVDPRNVDPFTYEYQSADGSSYTLSATLENTKDPEYGSADHGYVVSND